MPAAEVAPVTCATYGLRTVVVDGPLALRMRRLQAARQGEIGLQIMTLPQMAARLAGGFTRPATAEDLEPAARAALDAGGLGDIAGRETLPGMVRALSRTFDRLWRAGIGLADKASDHPRLADLALLESRVRAGLHGGALAPPDLLAAALARRSLAPRILGPVIFEQLFDPAPMWRPLVEALAEETPLCWRGRGPPAGWPAGTSELSPAKGGGAVAVFACAHTQAEAIEALRWVRELLASGRARPEEIALCAASPTAWDDTFLGLASAADLPLHFSHGVPALTTADGQACAALAELLDQGLSLERVRRLLSHGAGRSPGLMDIPDLPLVGVPAAAALTTLDQWRTALATAAAVRRDGADVAVTLLPVLQLVLQGLSVAEDAGAQLLPRGASRLWSRALQGAPAAALPFSLAGLRVPDGKDPGANVVWAPASHLVGAPRPWVRLLGMTSRAWPRPRRDDPLLPEHILSVDPELAPGRPESDRRLFKAIGEGATSQLALSYGRRSLQGGLLAPSPLIPLDAVHTRLGRLRIPEHAYSESDRLQARPGDCAADPAVARPVACVRARGRRDVTAWDGVVRPDHPVILEALAQVQSASSLRRLLRDPQAFVWRHALRWRETLEPAETLSLDDRAFGDLTHQLLQHTVVRLEAGPGFGRAAEHEVETALAAAVEQVSVEWPASRPTPPPLLWRHTLDQAAALALTALRLDPPFRAGTRSWTEAPFGEAAHGPEAAPWDPQAEVPVPGAEFRIRGRIDRLELAGEGAAARITDYKTGRAPGGADSLVLAGGAELQRVLYAIAVRRHFPDARLQSDLVYLNDPEPRRRELKDPEAAMRTVAELLNLAADLLRRGVSLPGPDSRERWNTYRLARPAAGEPQLKDRAIEDAFGPFRRVWTTP